MLAKIKNFVKENHADVILAAGVVLISLLSFALGYIVAKEEENKPVEIEFKARKSGAFVPPSSGLVADESFAFVSHLVSRCCSGLGL